MCDLYKISDFINVVSNSIGKIINFIDKIDKLPVIDCEIVNSYISSFELFYSKFTAINKLVANKIIFTDTLTFELADKINQTQNVPDVILNYYAANELKNYKELIHRCKINLKDSKYENLFAQIVQSSELRGYHLCCIGLFTILDGLLSDKTAISATSFAKRISEIKERMINKVKLSDIDMKVLLMYLSFKSVDNTIFSHSDFENAEPNSTNRHWVLHGRTNRQYTMLDFIMVLLWIDAIFSMR